MNRAGLLKRALGLAAAPALGRTGVLVDGHENMVGVGVPEPPLPIVGFTTGHMDASGAPAAHTHYATAYAIPIHTHGGPSHCLCYGNCRCHCR